MGTVLAQQYVVTDGGSTALTVVVLVLGIIVPLLVLAYVCRIFWRAKQRDDAEAEALRTDAWRNAHSS